MNVRDTLRSSLMMYPGIHPNALTVYDHLFCVIGNGYNWENGQLVEPGETKCNLKKAIIKSINFHLIDPVTDPFEYLEDFGLDFIKNRLQFKCKSVIKDVEMIFDTDNRMKDFSFETVDNYFKNEDFPSMSDKYMLYDICEYSKICNLPDNIMSDWLKAAEKMYDIMISNPDRVVDNKNLLPKIKQRIDELKQR